MSVRRMALRVVLVLVFALAFPSSALTALGDCGQPATGGESPTASDCLFILRTAVGTQACEPACICDTNGAGGTTATDALACLKVAVGQSGISLECPCGSGTTTLPTTTTTAPSGEPVLLGALTRTTGRFNYNLTLGIPGADAACDEGFPGTHSCTFAELLEAEAAGDLVGLTDTDGFPVRSFWAIDSSHLPTEQCHDVVAWDYQTAHTGTFAEIADLDDDTGDLGPVESATCAIQRWVGCCD